MKERLRVVVTGLAATYPYGGVFWDYLQYPLGLHRLGHEVLYLEDTGKWCYDPRAQTFVEEGRRNAAFLSCWIAALEPALNDRWFFRDAAGTCYGRPWRDVVDFCRNADLFLHLSASCWMRDEYLAAKRLAFIDSDPMFTQASVPGYLAGTLDDAARSRVEMLLAHDVFFTFGENVGAPDCRIPTELFDWKPTRQPVVLSWFKDASLPVARRRPVLTTVASWESTEKRALVEGVSYGGKCLEFERFLDLPERSALPLELALNGRFPRERLLAAGWELVDPNRVSLDPWTYRSYLARSLGEWSVAKHAYVESRSGWFSGRSACYLALGVPTVVQDTGFGCALPSGDGVLAFSTLDEAAAAIEAVTSDPVRHARAAREAAQAHFDAGDVLGRLIDEAFADSQRRSPQ
jgi:hypothetical protein